MPDARVEARSMHADEQLVVSGPRSFDVAKFEHIDRAVLVLNDGFHGCRFFLPLLSTVRPPSLLSSKLPTGPRQTVELPSHDEMEDDECENANERAWRERFDQEYGCRYHPNHPNHHAHSPKAPAKSRGPEHGHPKGNETYRH